MMRTVALSLLLAIAQPLAAQDFPSIFNVVDVAADDVLNIRAAPDAGAEIIGSLGPNETGVEVVSTGADGGWGQVSAGERAGWVSMRYLERVGPEMGFQRSLPRPMRCYGTEPFWSMTLADGGDAYETPEAGSEPLGLRAEERFGLDGFASYSRPYEGSRLTLLVDPQVCSDGMSDRVFGLRARLVLTDPEGAEVRRGCCTMDLR